MTTDAKIIQFPRRPPQFHTREEALDAVLQSMRRHPSCHGSKPSSSTCKPSADPDGEAQ